MVEATCLRVNTDSPDPDLSEISRHAVNSLCLSTL